VHYVNWSLLNIACILSFCVVVLQKFWKLLWKKRALSVILCSCELRRLLNKGEELFTVGVVVSIAG